MSLRKRYWIVLYTFLFLFSTAGAAHGATTKKYDEHFKKITKQYFADAVNWVTFKAQTKAESAFKENAKSYVGAYGLMQLMPFTSKEVAAQLGIPNMPADPYLNIQMGIFYDSKLWRTWKREVGWERISFMLGSYNAGTGNILKAQTKASALGLPTDRWTSIVSGLPYITGHYSSETIAYVKRIKEYYNVLIYE